MKFQKGSRRRALEYEKDLVRYWQDHKTFEKSVEGRPKDDAYVFYDGPPFITGVPHHGTLLSSVIKDAVPRYWTMKGKRVERVWGWDCHGLPAELYTEKKLGIIGKRDIGKTITLEEYILACRENMIQTGSEWEDTINRIGRWVDFKGAYKTMDKNYMESVWWAFKKLYDEGKIYEGEKVLLYCTRDVTPISKAEVAMDNSYQEVTDPSVYVKLRLKGWNDERRMTNGEGLPTYLLAWTTTPWTLPANTAAAVNKDETYAEVQVGDEVFVLAEALLPKVLTDEKHNVVPFTVLRTFKGEELVGRAYEPLFVDRGENAHKIWDANYVTLEEGTGVVHLAPAYGEEDYQLAKEKSFPIVSNIDDSGFYTEGEWQGQYVWDANKPIAKDLYERGVVWKIEYIRHSYPHCWRCGTKLMYRAHPSWFMNIQDQRDAMLAQNENITWFPEHIKHGRFEKTVESAPDWNLSRDRYWATALPVWKGVDKDGQEHIKVVGSYAELKELSGVELEDYHRPWVDDVTFEIDGVHYQRIDKVLDSWFEAGSMPYAQFHYPFENQDKFDQSFPGDFIAEYVPQVRAWFYYLHALSVGLWGKNTFKNVVVTGTIAGNDGRKMSKSYGNYTDPNTLMDQYSADALRFLLLSSPLLNAEDFALTDKDVADVARKLGMIWNMYDFFTLYADVDGWDSGLKPGELPADPMGELTNPLDQWIVSRLHETARSVDEHMQRYDLPNALKPVLPFLDDASNWYVRRSRRRFWRAAAPEEGTVDGERQTMNDEEGMGNGASSVSVPASSFDDKNQAYRTLHYVLVRLSLVLAPFTPFLAEELYRKLTDGESVHLEDWPTGGEVNELLLASMAQARELITEGLAQRAAAGLKVRQPLAAAVGWAKDIAPEYREFMADIVAEELNVKRAIIGDEPELQAQAPAVLYKDLQARGALIVIDQDLTPALKREGVMREIVRNVQNARKQAGLEIDDRIDLQLGSDHADVEAAFTTEELAGIIKQETLAVSLNKGELKDAYACVVKIGTAELGIKLRKAQL